ncbi:MAG: DUF4032 domain-containing protein [Actinomycetota bacterium]|nr:DUF4032 domain-containing protein [Actinomycetota bacterium]
MRFLFVPPADDSVGLLDLPWDEPLETWQDHRLVDVRQAGIHRHVVRFVFDNGELYALKELDERLARREYDILRRLDDVKITVVDVKLKKIDRGPGLDAILVTRFLDFSLSYRSVFSNPYRTEPIDRLLDALVELLVRLHLAGCFWGDCSLSNTLFRPDAGTLAAFLVDAETAEMHPALTDGQRHYDLDLASERVGGELFDLQAGGLLPEDLDPVGLSEEIPRRYNALWEEITLEEVLQPEEQRYRVAARQRRLNELGFDVDEVELVSTDDGTRVRLRTKIAEPGYHRRRLLMRTGLAVQENQARHLLNDIASFRGYLEQRDGHPVSEPEAASRWLSEIFDPTVSGTPEDLRGRLEPAQVFTEILEHRWFLSEAAGRDVGTTQAAQSYFGTVLPAIPEPTTVAPLEL